MRKSIMAGMVLLILTCVGCHQARVSDANVRPVLNQIRAQICAVTLDLERVEGKLSDDDKVRARAGILEATKAYNMMVRVYRAEHRIDSAGQDAVTVALAAVLNIVKGVQ